MKKIHIILYIAVIITTISLINICFLQGFRFYYADYNQSIFIKYQSDLGQKNIQNYCSELKPAQFPIYFSTSLNITIISSLLLIIIFVLFSLSKMIALKKGLILVIVFLLILSTFAVFYTVFTQPERILGMC